MIFTDNFRPYKFLHRHNGYRHEFVNHSEGEYARGDVRISTTASVVRVSTQALEEEVYGSE
jgi:hypothetical protein